MKKRVAIINDDLGTMALGFSKAGYDVSAIYVTQADKNSIRVLEDNWGEVVRRINGDDFNKQKLFVDLEVDFVAGKIVSGLSVAGKQREPIKVNETALQAVCLLKEIRPKFCLFQCNKYNNENFADRWLLDSIIQLGYTIEYQYIDTRLITGLPVKEKTCFLFGSLEQNPLKFEFLKSVDTLNYSLEFLCEKKTIEDKWYYHVNPRHLQDVERYSDNAVLCWNANHYKEVEFVNWNPRMIPLVAQGDMIRKITHREIARLKGIPDEYYLHVQDKMRLYQKLMYAPNVQLVQQVVSAICIEINGEYFQKREVSKSEQFERIIDSFLKKKGIECVETISDVNKNVDFQVQIGTQIYCFDLKIYRNNHGVEDKLVALCEKYYTREGVKERKDILIIANIVDKKVKKKIEDTYKISVWDVENILWIFEEFPQIKSDFVSLLSFSVSDIVPEKPEGFIFEQHLQASATIDLQERLRKVPPGEEPSTYEKLCEEIMRYLFSENLEFFPSQRISNDGLYRFDYCAKIKHGNTNEFFDTIKNFFQTKYIVFEFKNYKDEITQKEVYTTEKYLYEKALRKVAIIVSRKGADTNAKKAIRGSLRESGKLIICLSDKNINKLIDIKNNKGEPGNHLEDLLDEMLMDLEK